MTTTQRLRELLHGPNVIRSLGAHDVFTARLMEAAGLETVFIGGFGTSASMRSAGFKGEVYSLRVLSKKPFAPAGIPVPKVENDPSKKK